MRKFRNQDTGEIFTEDEIRNIYEGEQCLVENYPTFDEYIGFLLFLGVQDVVKELFEVMRYDEWVMEAYEGDENALRQELESFNEDTLKEFAEIYL